MNNFIAWTPNHQQNLIDVLNWIQAAYGETEDVYGDTVIAKKRSRPICNSSILVARVASREREEADRAEVFAGESQSAATSALNTVSSLTPRLGLNIGNWKIEDGELIVSHLTTATPTIVQGDFTLTYEEIEDFA